MFLPHVIDNLIPSHESPLALTVAAKFRAFEVLGFASEKMSLLVAHPIANAVETLFATTITARVFFVRIDRISAIGTII